MGLFASTCLVKAKAFFHSGLWNNATAAGPSLMQKSLQFVCNVCIYGHHLSHSAKHLCIESGSICDLDVASNQISSLKLQSI